MRTQPLIPRNRTRHTTHERPRVERGQPTYPVRFPCRDVQCDDRFLPDPRWEADVLRGRGLGAGEEGVGRGVDVSCGEEDLVASNIDGGLGAPDADAGPGARGGVGGCGGGNHGDVPVGEEGGGGAVEGQGGDVAGEGAAGVGGGVGVEEEGGVFFGGGGADEEGGVVESGAHGDGGHGVGVGLVGAEDVAGVEVGGDNEGPGLRGEVEDGVLGVDLGAGAGDGDGGSGLEDGERAERLDEGGHIDLPFDGAGLEVERHDGAVPGTVVGNAVQDGRRRAHANGVGDLAVLAEGLDAGGGDLRRRDPAVVEV